MSPPRPPAPAPEAPPAKSDGDGDGPLRLAWLTGPAMLAASLAAVALVQRGPGRLFAVALGVLLGIALLWIVVSVFWPASVDRRCPACGADALARLDPGSTRGLVCRTCGFADATSSSFLLAEEEGGLDEIVLRERERGD